DLKFAIRDRIAFPVVVSRGSHPFPSRTRKLSLLEPMVLRGQLCGRVGSRRDYYNKSPLRQMSGGLSCHLLQSSSPGSSTPHCPGKTKLKAQSPKYFICGVPDARAHAFSVATMIPRSSSRWLDCMNCCATTAVLSSKVSIRFAS